MGMGRRGQARIMIKINEHEILSASSLEYFVRRQCQASPWFMLMPDAGNKSVQMSKTAYLEIKQPKELLCFGGPLCASKQA